MGLDRWARTVGSYLPDAITTMRRHADTTPVGRVRGPHRVDDLAFRGFRRPNPVVVHAGTDIGASVASIRHRVGRCRIHAFEPNARLHDHLRHHDVTVHGELLAADAGATTLHVPRYGRSHFDVEASLDHATAAMFLGDRNFARYRPARAAVDTHTVATATLDSFGLAPDIIVLDESRDAAGALRGATQTLADHQPLIRIDGGGADTAAAVEALGYVPARYDPGADCIVLEQPGRQSTWLVHPHHRSLIGISVV